MGALRFQLLDGGIIHFSKRLRPPLLSGRTTMSRQPQRLDFVAAIFFLGQQLPRGGLGSVRALASFQGLLPAPERRNNGAPDLYRDTSGKSWKHRDLFLDSTDAVAAAQFPGAT